MKKIIVGFYGFCMALADSVPGVSGGTIAFILGFYDKFIGSIDALISGKKAEKIEALKFLIKILIGWLIGFLSAVAVLSSVFETHIYFISSLFMGFIFFAIPLIIKEERETIKGHYWKMIFILLGIGIVSAITYFNSGSNVIETSGFNIGLGLYALVSGAIAISAMVLPGISGSTIMLVFGLYVPIITGIKDMMKLNFHAAPMLICFGIGIIIGFATVVKLIKKSLEKFRAQTVYLILGMMVGSFYAIIMGPQTLKEPQTHLTWSTFSIIAFLIGGVVILGLQFAKMYIEKNHGEKVE